MMSICLLLRRPWFLDGMQDILRAATSRYGLCTFNGQSLRGIEKGENGRRTDRIKVPRDFWDCWLFKSFTFVGAGKSENHLLASLPRPGLSTQ